MQNILKIIKMLETSETYSLPSNRSSFILDSPTLARVERARLRVEGSDINRTKNCLERTTSSNPYHSLLAGVPVDSISGPIKRGLLWQQRDRIFSRWKERYFVLTRDYLHCFKRASKSNNDRISDMGPFIFKIKLFDVEKVEWLNRRSYSIIGLQLGREGRVLLRSGSNLEDWFELLEECTLNSKERRRVLRVIQGPRSRASLAAPSICSSVQESHGGTYSSAIEDWLLSRNKAANSVNHFVLSDSVPDLSGFNDNFKSSNHCISAKKVNSTTSRYSLNNTKNKANNDFGFIPQNVCNKIDKNEYDFQLRSQRRIGNGNNSDELLYQRPNGPHDHRHSLLTDIDISAFDSGLDTPSSTNRPSSYRNVHYMNFDTKAFADSARCSSHGETFHFKENTNNLRNKGQLNNNFSLHNEGDVRVPSKNVSDNRSLNTFDSNLNHYSKNSHRCANGNESIVMRERYQHPALLALINESNGAKFRDRSHSDIQQISRRPSNYISSNSKQDSFFNSPT